MALILKEQSTRRIPQYSIVHYENIYPDSMALANSSNYADVVNRQIFHETENTPGFRTLTKSQRKKLPVNNYRLTAIARPLDKGHRYVDRTDLFYQSTRGSARSIISAFNDGPTFVEMSSPPDLNSDQLSYVKSKTRAKVQGAKVNLAQAFAERQQTANLLMTTAGRFVSAVKALRKGNIPKALRSLALEVDPKRVDRLRTIITSGRLKSRYSHEEPRDPLIEFVKRAKVNPITSKSVASAWLELQYGWKPLMSDIFGSCELLAETVRSDTAVAIVDTRSNWNRRIDYMLRHTNTDSGLGTVTEKDVSKTRILLEYKLDDPTKVLLGKTGLTNPALLAWELLPFSFVADWFIGVGDYLDSFTTFDGLVFRRGFINQSRVKRFNSTAENLTSSTYSLFYHDIYNWDLDCRNFQFSRRRLNGFWDLEPDFPSLKNPFSKSHVASALALLKVVFLSKSKSISFS